MKIFSLRLRPPQNSITFENVLFVYRDTPSPANLIGQCTIEHDNQSMIGVFQLEQDVLETQYVYYLANMTEELPHLHGIVISNENVRANTIENSLIA